jgi:phosphatidylglycerol lysyltransferase
VFFRWAAQVAVTKAGGTGLRQFKSAFSPRWSARYAAAPNPIALAVGLADIAREVHCPAPIDLTAAKNIPEIHNNDENYVLAS